MTRLSVHELQTRLDQALTAHPDRATLGDFRAPQALADAEAEALAYASRIVTPHAEIARLFSGKAAKLLWKLPLVPAVDRSPLPRRIAFPGPTIARKGAYALRDAARALDLEIVLLGGELEGPDFWRGIRTLKPKAGSHWLDGVAAVVQPAIVEERPRYLLMARAAGVPVIATDACGLTSEDEIVRVPADDPAALISALETILSRTD